ncbi:hypothetical protein DMA15_21890 [Streptomyces sp. WAC 01529]|uniref:Pycsar system effector family protein n=1 Tax=Streptomyces sp. WAC 01529 TaxID=2203205 RepID=UPI000F6D0A5E|nr:Pycsar system effector family protein [Streptomyces sp. WAC 01529]AZM54882.1 hypothetical protein DMA15_21890 [Streptomyces sp. WAC 01529]
MTGADTRTPAPEPGAEAAARLLLELRAEIARADTKAAVLMAALGVTAGTATTLLAEHGWSPAARSAPGSSAWWAGLLALGLAVVALLMAVLPRYDARGWTPGAPLTHFADVRQAARCGRLEQALAETERTTSASAVAALSETSRIALRKHQWIRTGLIALATAVVLLPSSLLIG